MNHHSQSSSCSKDMEDSLLFNGDEIHKRQRLDAQGRDRVVNSHDVTLYNAKESPSQPQVDLVKLSYQQSSPHGQEEEAKGEAPQDEELVKLYDATVTLQRQLMERENRLRELTPQQILYHNISQGKSLK